MGAWHIVSIAAAVVAADLAFSRDTQDKSESQDIVLDFVFLFFFVRFLLHEEYRWCVVVLRCLFRPLFGQALKN